MASPVANEIAAATTSSRTMALLNWRANSAEERRRWGHRQCIGTIPLETLLRLHVREAGGRIGVQGGDDSRQGDGVRRAQLTSFRG